MPRTTHFDRLPETLRPQTAVPIGRLEWRPVSGYPDYEISSFGLVRRATPGRRHARGAVLRPSLSDGLYPTVELFRDGRGRTERVHVLLARAFVREPLPGEVVRHLDGRPQVPTAWTVGYGDDGDNARDRRHHAAARELAEPSEQLLAAACATVDMLLLGTTMRAAAERWGVSPSKAAKLRSYQRHSAPLALLHAVIERFETRGTGAATRQQTVRRAARADGSSVGAK